MNKKPEFINSLRDFWEKFLNRVSDRWIRWGRFKKCSIILFIIFGSLFVLFWISSAALVSLPVITAIYFLTWIVKNILDIINNWRWGNIFLGSSRKESEMVKEKIVPQAIFLPSQDMENSERKEHRKRKSAKIRV